MWRRACGSSEDRTALIKAAPALARRGFCQQLWPQLQVKRVVTYRRKKQRMPPAIRARKAQQSAAPMWSPTPEAVEGR